MGSGAEALVERLCRGRVLVVGDLILDRRVSGDAERVSPEAPVQILSVTGRGASSGGAANVACKVAELEGQAVLVGIVGDDAEGAELVRLSEALGVDCSGVVICKRPTTTKTRYVARGQQLLRVDSEVRTPISDETAARLARAIASELPGCDAVVMEDYGKGALVPGVLAAALARSRRRDTRRRRPLRARLVLLSRCEGHHAERPRTRHRIRPAAGNRG